MKKIFTTLSEKLEDERSKKVIFVSHCILNENTRYLGGAFKKGTVHEIVNEIQKKGIGIVQVRCPERIAWGGVMKPYTWLPLKIRNSVLVKISYPFFMWYTRMVYKKIAKDVVSEIRDYIDSGFEVIGYVGVSASPTCSIYKAIDGSKFVDYLLSTGIGDIDRERMNGICIEGALINSSGLFICVLRKILNKRNMNIKFYEHDLIQEMKGDEIKFKL